MTDLQAQFSPTGGEGIDDINHAVNSQPSSFAPSNLLSGDHEFTSIVDSDNGMSDNDDTLVSGATPEEEVQEVVGVSMGPGQILMKSPQTPAVEKARAMAEMGEFFDGAQDGGEIEDSETDHMPSEKIESTFEPPRDSGKPQSSPRVGPSDDPRSKASLPSPWRAGLKESQRSDAGRSFLRDGLMAPRRRASSGPSNVSDTLKKFLPAFPIFTLPKSPSFASFSPFGSAAKDDSSNEASGRPKRSSTLFARGSILWSAPGDRSSSRDRSQTSTMPESQRETNEANAASNTIHGTDRNFSEQESTPSLVKNRGNDGTVHSYALRGSGSGEGFDGRPGNLRRATSDNSLFLRRTTSKTSTLDDIGKWENVQDQVNNRFKAIKDSFQDSSIRLPSMPSINLSAFRPEFAYGRANSDMMQHKEVLDKSRGGIPQDGLTARYVEVGHSRPAKHGHGHHPKAATHVRVANELKNTHPILADALSKLTGDVVVMGGYRGSILRSAKPPHRQLWIPVKVGLNLRKVDLEVGLEPEDEENMEETIIPSGTLSHIGPVDICRRLLKKLRKCENARNGSLRVWDYGYDWRLSPHLLSRRFIEFVKGLESNAPCSRSDSGKGPYILAHSLGGLITRHAVNQRPELFAGVVYAGVPQTCVNILGPLRNGDEVLLSSRVLTAQVNFTLRTSFVLLPEDGQCFIDKRTGEEYPVDFFDVNTWDQYRLSPCIRHPSPPSGYEHRRSLIDTMSSSLPSLPIPGKRSSLIADKESSPERRTNSPASKAKDAVKSTAETAGDALDAAGSGANPSGDTVTPSFSAHRHSSSSSLSTACTISRPRAVAYLRRTLAETLQFKRELAFLPAHESSNHYPPFAVIYTKSVPTVYGARVASREAIKRSDAYDDLCFAAGDGVCLARAAMLPKGYRCVKGGLVKSERGHVGLLGDLEGVGRCIAAVVEARRRGVGLGFDG